MRLLAWVAGNVQYYMWSWVDVTERPCDPRFCIAVWVDDYLLQPIFRAAYGEVEPEYHEDNRHHPLV